MIHMSFTQHKSALYNSSFDEKENKIIKLDGASQWLRTSFEGFLLH